mmetsp:Transcript_27674/g.33656  ORF Transcript_27674/g.33656 Transcript_27674/m.33656 type:complete len:268 (+) Transcript_27674:399-1202(+)
MFNVNHSRNLRVFLLDTLQHLFLIRRRKSIIIMWTQLSRPRIENLNELRPAFDLMTGIIANFHREMIQNVMEKFGFFERHFFYFEVVAGGATFHEVRGERVRTSDETEQGGGGGYFCPEGLERLGDKGSGDGRIQFLQFTLGIVPIFNRFHDRTHLLIDLKLAAHPGQWRQNITKQNTSVRLIVTNGLEAHFRRHLRDFGPLSKRGILFDELAVLRNVTSGLSHHPDGGSFGFEAFGGADEEGKGGGVIIGGGGIGGGGFCCRMHYR